MRTAIVLLTRDLRIRDNPALAAAADSAERVIPLFVIDDGLTAARTPNRTAFLLDALSDLRASLRGLGADLVLRRGDPVAETVDLARRFDAGAIFLASDHTPAAMRRRDRLRAAAEIHRVHVRSVDGPTVIEPGAITPSGGDHYRVFTPYWRVWKSAPWRSVAPTPESLRLPAGVEVGELPSRSDLSSGTASPALGPGGETAGRHLVNRWVRASLDGYEDHHDDLAGDRTSHLGAHLHFGTVSALELASWVRERAAGEPFLRQLCWRDFHHQVTAAFPSIMTSDYRSRGDDWNDDPEALAAWAEGRTGFPIVDAGMRQLLDEGWMHNRARLITASFLTKDLYLDWRTGARHFMDHLVDADVANNYGNWQWVASTGNDTRPNRVLNPHLQAKRFDPDGAYVRRHVPELVDLPADVIHEPWKLPPDRRRQLDYPSPIVDHAEAVAEFRERRP